MSATYPRASATIASRAFSLAVRIVVFIVAGMPATSWGDTYRQTDWSGGPDEQTPVLEWSDTFRKVTQTSWRSVPGQIVISSYPTDPTGGPVVQPSPSCHSVASGDLDGDGDIDLISPLGGEVHWYENAGDGIHWTERVVDDDFYGGEGITTGDIDGDGDLDIVASAFYGNPTEDGRYVWYENLHGDASAWAKDPIAGYLWGTEMAAVIDMDKDGDLDIYGCSTLTHVGNFNDDIYWFDNINGDGSVWMQRRIDDDYADAIDAAAADVDRDGDIDIVCTSYETRDIHWWENVGGGGTTWIRHPIVTNTPADNTLEVADIDDDGDIDVVATGWQAGYIALFENADGYGGSWIGRVVGVTGGRGRDVGIADLDGDGRLDVLGVTISAVYWYRNLGGNAFTTYLVTYPERTGEAAIAADINGDGALEIVYAVEGYYYGDIAGLFRRSITLFRGSGELESAVLDAQDPRTWTAIDWDAQAPIGTALAFQVRSSNDPEDLGDWSEEITSPGPLFGHLAPDTRYAQYRVLLSTEDPHASPIVREVTLRGADPAAVPVADPQSPVRAGGTTLIALDAPWPNPSSGMTTTRLVLAASGSARIDILDAQGRCVATPLAGRVPAGAHELELPALTPGVYLVRLSARGASRVKKLAVR